MKNGKRNALIAGGAAVLVIGSAALGWQVHQYRQEQAFIADQYAKLEADKAALDAEPTPEPFDRGRSVTDCQALYAASADSFPLGDEKFDEPTVTKVSEDLYSISGTARGNDREDGYGCTVVRDGITWSVELR